MTGLSKELKEAIMRVNIVISFHDKFKREPVKIPYLITPKIIQHRNPMAKPPAVRPFAQCGDL